jgi:serine/threonine-protein kinase
MSLQTGDLIEGKYRIVRLLGEGGMGSVYEGDNTRIHRRVAIKVLHAAVAAKSDVVQRFEREAQAAGRIGSEHIVEVLDLGNLPGGERFMVMEFLEGENLGDRIKKRRRMTPQEVGPIIHQLLEGLAAAHQAGIVHRDLKPDNVYLCLKGGQRDFVKVLDFGVSKFSTLDSDMSMTKTGAVMGTPFYMSPEQARGGKIDLRSDLYSVGVVIYQAVTGRLPFHAETFNELVFKIALESPEPAEIAAPGLDAHFAQIIARAMMRDPNGRFQSAREFQAALAQWMMTSGPFPSSPHASFAGATDPLRGPSMPGGPVAPWGSASQSGPYPQQPMAPQQMYQSGPQLHPSLAQSGGPVHLNQSMSQGGLVMTTPQKSGSGALIAGALVAVGLLCGGGFAAYKVFGSRAPVAAQDAQPAGNAASPPADPKPEATAAAKDPTPAAAPAAPTESAEPSAEPAAEATTSADAAPAPQGHAPAHAGGPIHHGGPLPKPSAAPAATPVAAPKPAGGRSIGGDL